MAIDRPIIIRGGSVKIKAQKRAQLVFQDFEDNGNTMRYVHTNRGTSPTEINGRIKKIEIRCGGSEGIIVDLPIPQQDSGNCEIRIIIEDPDRSSLDEIIEAEQASELQQKTEV